MEREDLRGEDVRRFGEGYAEQGELIEDLSSWLDLLLFFYYRKHRWLGPSGELKNMLGLVVSREEFEHHLSGASARSMRMTGEERAQADLAFQAVALRLERTEADLPLVRLFRTLCPDRFSRFCVLLAYLPRTEPKYEKLFAYLQDDMTRRAPGTDLACRLYPWEDVSPETAAARFAGRDGAARLFERPEEGRLVLRDMVTEFLSLGHCQDREGLTVFRGCKAENPLNVHPDTARHLDAVRLGCVLLSGPSGGGKRFQIEQFCVRHGVSCVFADLRGDGWRERAEAAALAADLSGAYLCLYHLDREGADGEPVPPGAEMLETLEKLELRSDRRFFLSTLPLHGRQRGFAVELELPPVTEAERLSLFRYALDGVKCSGFTAEELAAKFHFQPRQIVRACEQAAGLSRLAGEDAVSAERIHECCYRQSVHRLGELAASIPAAHGWDDVVLPEAQKRLMREAADHIRLRHKVYTQWDFQRKITYGRGLSVLFAGLPGTGKTLCAQVIAHELNMELYRIDLSQVVSKYIGETEKNLRAVFREAGNAGCVLFFDECDALFGRRSDVKDAHDRHANVEVAYLLQQIEDHDGVCILATNLTGNIDPAFMRRITYVVRFPFPDAAARERIFRQMLPEAAPVSDDIDWAFLADRFELSGGHIKNIVLNAAFLAAGEDAPISMRHLLRSAVEELRKNEIVVVRERLREYEDLLGE